MRALVWAMYSGSLPAPWVRFSAVCGWWPEGLRSVLAPVAAEDAPDLEGGSGSPDIGRARLGRRAQAHADDAEDQQAQMRGGDEPEKRAGPVGRDQARGGQRRHDGAKREEEHECRRKLYPLVVRGPV